MIDTSIFYDISKDIDDHIAYYIVIGGRGCGKTYSALRFILENGKTPIYIRNTLDEMEISCSAEGNPFKRINANMHVNYGFEKVGKFYHMCSYAEDKPKRIGLGMALSTVYKVRGADFSDTNIILYDEFIPDQDQILRFNEGRALLQFYETCNRNREILGEPPLKVILLSNANHFKSKVLAELDVIDELERMLRNNLKRLTIPKRRIRIILPENEEFKAVKSETALYQALKNSTFKDMALNNKFTDISYQHVKKRRLTEYIAECAYEDLYIYRHKSRYEYYVSKSRADCEVYTEKDTKVLFLRRWYPYKDDMLDGGFIYESYHVKQKFLSLFFK